MSPAISAPWLWIGRIHDPHAEIGASLYPRHPVEAAHGQAPVGDHLEAHGDLAGDVLGAIAKHQQSLAAYPAVKMAT